MLYFAGVERVVNTSDLSPSLFIFTKRGEAITATLVTSPVFTKGNVVTQPVGFDTTDNENRGLSIIINRTNANIRPVQLRIEVQHHPFGLLTNADFPPPPIGGQVGSLASFGKITNFEFNITNEFVDYLNHEKFIHPRNSLNLDFDDWRKSFDQEIITTNAFIGHYFVIKVLLTDKSGRTIKLRSGHFWVPIPGTDLLSSDPISIHSSFGLADTFVDGDSTSGINLGNLWVVKIT